MNVVGNLYARLEEPLAAVEETLQRVLTAEDAVAPMARHLLGSGGKRMRPMLTLLAAAVFTDRLDPIVPVAAATELVHMATLVHDDVIDMAPFRRGRPTVNRLWDTHTAVLTGDCLLARALVMLVEHGDPFAVRVMSDMIYKMCEGEIEQHLHVFNPDETEENYFQRIEKKTALFFGACCEVGAHLGGAPHGVARCLAEYGRLLGMAFQIVDDLLDVGARAEVVGKPTGSDLASGVVTLPVIYLLRQPGQRERIEPMFRKGRLTGSEVGEILELTRANGALDYAYRIASRFAAEARDQLAAVEEGEATQALRGLTEVVVKRSF